MEQLLVIAPNRRAYQQFIDQQRLDHHKAIYVSGIEAVQGRRDCPYVHLEMEPVIRPHLHGIYDYLKSHGMTEITELADLAPYKRSW